MYLTEENFCKSGLTACQEFYWKHVNCNYMCFGVPNFVYTWSTVKACKVIRQIFFEIRLCNLCNNLKVY